MKQKTKKSGKKTLKDIKDKILEEEKKLFISKEEAQNELQDCHIMIYDFLELILKYKDKINIPVGRIQRLENVKNKLGIIKDKQIIIK